MTLFSRYPKCSALIAFLFAGVLSPCSRNSGDVSVQASAVEVEDPSGSPSATNDLGEEESSPKNQRSPSSQAFRRSVEYMNGVYESNCDEKQGSFSVAVNGYTGTMPNPSLTVSKEDEDCTVKISSLVAGGVTYIAKHELIIGEDFKNEPTSFVGPTGDTIFVNAKLSNARFKINFLLQVIHSKRNEHAKRDHIPNHRIEVSNLPNEDELAPKYLVNPLGLTVFVDSSGMITGSAGKVHFLTLDQTGEDYIVSSTEPPASIEELQAAFTSPSSINSPAKRFFISQESLSFVGKVIPKEGLKRYIVIRHTDQEGSHFQKLILTLFPSKR